MPIPRLQNLTPSPRTAGWTIGTVVLVFLVVTGGVLLSNVTRDDVVALHNGFDAAKLSDADVGSFFEVYVDRIHGPLCTDRFSPADGQLQAGTRDVHVVNKLGETLPILTKLPKILFSWDDDAGTPAAFGHDLQLQLTQASVRTDILWEHTRNVMNGDSLCKQAIDDRTRDLKVRICPVYQVWRDNRGHVQALFFDPVAINGCRDNSDPDCSACPAFAAGQFWTRLKIMFDLLEEQGPEDASAAATRRPQDIDPT